MLRYKHNLLTSIDKMIKEVQTDKLYCTAQQDYSGESFISVSPAWEVQLHKENARIAGTMLELLIELRKKFDELT